MSGVHGLRRSLSKSVVMPVIGVAMPIIGLPARRCRFTGATVNLHLLAGSPMIGMATPITGITTDFDNDLRNPCTPDIGGDEFTSYSGPAIANLTITKTADANTVAYGAQVGFVVELTNTTSNTALGLTVSDNLP